jgi:hypothetical protein
MAVGVAVGKVAEGAKQTAAAVGKVANDATGSES